MKLRPLSYILIKSAKNKLRLIRKNPTQLLAYIVFFGFLVFATFKSRNNPHSSNVVSVQIYGGIATALIVLLTIPDLVKSLKEGNSFFRAADINLVFTAPISPQNILMYGFIKQIYTIAVTVLILLFQLPTLYQCSNIKSYAVWVILATLLVLLIANSVTKMLLYSLASKNDHVKVFIGNLFKALGLLLVIAYFACLYTEKSPIAALFSILNSPFIQYVPVYGWSRNIAMAAIAGTNISTYIYMFFMIAYIVLCIYLLYSLDLDYYEDVIASTDIKENRISAARNRGNKGIYSNRKQRTHKVSYKNRGNGASAIFFRHLLEYRKTGFGLFNITSALFLVIGISVGMFKLIDDISMLLGLSVYFLMLFSFTSKWKQELDKPYIFIIPDSSFKKVVFSTILENVKNLLDGVILFSIVGFFVKTPLILILLCILAFVSYGSLFIYGGLFTQRILGNSTNVVFTSLIRIFMLIFIILPGMLGFVFLSISFQGTSNLIPYFALIAFNIAFSSLIIAFSKGIFENIELS